MAFRYIMDSKCATLNHLLIIIFNSFLDNTINSNSNYGQMQSNLPIANENVLKNTSEEKQIDNINILQVFILIFKIFCCYKDS